MSKAKKIEFSATLSNRGQITVPQDLREQLGITLDQKAQLKIVIQVNNSNEETLAHRAKIKAFKTALAKLPQDKGEKFDAVEWLKKERGDW